MSEDVIWAIGFIAGSLWVIIMLLIGKIMDEVKIND